MDIQEAREIAALLNRRSRLTIAHTETSVLAHASNYASKIFEGHVVAAVEVKPVQWYQAELCHLTVHENHEGKGFARELVALAEQRARGLGARVIQCTIREGNGDSERLFRAAGYCRTLTFYNQNSGNTVSVWQKALVTGPSQ